MRSPTVLVVEDDADFRDAIAQTLQLAGLSVREAEDGERALGLLGDPEIDLVISDVQMPSLDGLGLLRRVKALRPGLPMLMMTAFGTVQQAVEAIREGAEDYLLKPFESQVLVAKASSYLGRRAESPVRWLAADRASVDLFELARRVAASDVSVMISGESGVGKEVLARFVHAHSSRAAEPFVAINCAAIPATMLESLLFGYEKGAFTGAHKACPGKFEQAQGGTVLLDEITEMDLALQAKLLRVLQEREVERLGGRGTVPLDVRILATSNRNLAEVVSNGSFREDLFYRLNVFPLRVPPLRERPDDIVPIAERVLAEIAPAAVRGAPRLTAPACERLRAHRWPGNVRELENVVQRAALLAGAPTIGVEHLRFDAMGGEAPAAEPARAPEGTLDGDLRTREHDIILEALTAAAGNRARTAERLGISPRTLRYKLARMREAGIAIT